MTQARDWRKALTPAERLQLKKLDQQIAKLSDDLILLRTKRNRIVNRASVRGRRQ